MNAAEMLSRKEPFRTLSDRELAEIAGTYHIENYSAGQKLMQYGDIIRKIGLIEHGEVYLMAPVFGEDMRKCGTLSDGDFIVDAGVFTNGRSTSSLYCKTRLQCHVQAKTDYLAMLRAYPDLREYFYKLALTRLAHAFGMLNVDSERTPDLGDEETDTTPFPKIVRNALLYIEKNYTHQIKLGDVARANAMSKYHFSRIFRQNTGVSFKEYLNARRIERAKYLMRHEEMNVTQAAFAVGFNDLSYFSRLFQTKEGRPPSEYRKAKGKRP
jgi:AraC-like DNA-binding protein